MLKGIRLLGNILMKRPVLCLWQVTGRCNFTCRICEFWRENNNERDELSLDQVKVVVSKLESFSPMMVSLAGGEPLLRHDLPQIVKEVARKHYCSIITNGWFMTRELARDLYRNGLRDAMVSIDYAVPGLHDDQRGMDGAFNRALQAVETLRDLKPGREHRVRILAVLMEDNIREIEGLLLIAEELSVSLSVTLYSDHFGRRPDYRPEEPVSDYLLELKRRHKAFDSAAAYLASFDEAMQRGVAGCGGGLTFMNINHRGMISRCVDRHDMPVADPLRQSAAGIKDALHESRNREDCARCWTSCRGLADIITGPSGMKSYPDFIRSGRPVRR